ncbi:uncharacterized protein LOC135476417 [Liolophura sinensis]|uniref:uncharacterized protein LOC135476417 n=1 Tax=Liolophura sinensis TaxID=3198878 RepID=UPI00315861FF
MWLPDPVLDQSGEHYKPFETVNGTETSEDDCPSLLEEAAKAQQKKHVLTAQNAQAVFECVECKKPKVVYSKSKLTERQQAQPITTMTEYEYSCGAPVIPPNNPLYSKVFMRLGITCESLVETPYYSSDIGQKDLCCFCGTDKGTVNTELKKQ